MRGVSRMILCCCNCPHLWRMSCRAAENGELFGGKVPEDMRKMEQFETRFMAAAAQDNSAELSTTAGVLSEAFGMDAASIDLADLQEVGIKGSLVE